jgi:phage tail sheath gpL-like
MPVDFQFIQPNTLLPLFYAEVTSAQEPISPNLRLCLIGHMNIDATGPNVDYGAGDAVANTLYILSGTEATSLFGRGSMLEWMYQKARANAPTAEIWAIACGTDVSGVRATATIEVVKTGSTARQGAGGVYIAGRLVTFKIGATDTKEQIAHQLQNKINAASLPVKASGATGVVGETTITLTARWPGVTGNDLRVSYVGPHGRADASGLRVSLTRYILTYTAFAGGAGELETATTFAAIGDRPFDLFAFAQASGSQLDACQVFMDNGSGRWSPYKQLYGHMVTSMKGTFSGAFSYVSTRNDPHMTILAMKQSICPTWEWTASLAAVMITHWAAPPELSRPLQTLPLLGMYVGADDDDTYDKTEREQLLSVGASTFHVMPDTSCVIDRVRTTRKYNLFNDPDPSWADAVTMFQAQYFVRSMRTAITGAVPRAALTDEPIGINGFTSPPEIENIVIHEYKRLQSLGLVENVELFSQYLVCERNPVDRNRVDILMRPDFVNQLRVVAVVVETHLELDPTDPLLQLAA